jgi:Haem-binding domain
LNFSEWHRPQREAAEAAEEVTAGGMPPLVYLAMHRHARLSAADRVRLARGLARTLGSVKKQAGD